MKQTIPFKKDITFKTTIGELTAISLDNDLTLKGEDLIVGNFYINGNYKIQKDSEEEQTYSYKIPCEIAISDEYDAFDANIDIDDFYYEIINDEVLRVNITVVISNLERKEIYEEPIKEIEVLKDDDLLRENTEPKQELNKEQELNPNQKEETNNQEPKKQQNIKIPQEEIDINIKEIEKPRNNTNFYEVKENIKTQTDTYLTYKVYIYKEEDTIESILEKYNITKEELNDYNNLEEIIPGTKIVIPSSNDKL